MFTKLLGGDGLQLIKMDPLHLAVGSWVSVGSWISVGHQLGSQLPITDLSAACSPQVFAGRLAHKGFIQTSVIILTILCFVVVLQVGAAVNPEGWVPETAARKAKRRFTRQAIIGVTVSV